MTKALKVLAGAMAVLILVTAGGLWWAFRHYDAQISRIAVPPIPGVTKPSQGVSGENFLLVGSDSREGANAEGTQGTGSEFVTGQRSDTIILVHLYESSDNVELISFPRDSWVEIPRYTDPKTGRTTPARHAKLNTAFSLGGPSLLVATLEQLTNLRIDHYLEVDFTGFKAMVDKVGGVDVCLTKPARDRYSGINLSAGRHHLSGDVALAFVRQRHGLAQGDIDRIARQQQFIGSLANKVLSAGTLLDPFKLTGFLDAATSSLKADDDLKAGDLRKLALRLRHFSSRGVLFTTVPVTSANARRSGQSVVLLDDTRVDALFQALRNDQAPPGAAPPPKPSSTPVPASEIRVAVFNGAGIAGLGRRVAGALSEQGFTVVGEPGNRGTGATETTVRFKPGHVAEARRVQGALPRSVLVKDESLGSTIEVVVGSSYGRPAPKPSVTARPSAAAPVKTAQHNPCTR